MADLRGFNANTVEPMDSFDPIPAGEYLCVITASEEKPTKAGNGSYLQLEFEVIEGPYKGRKLWERLNLNNPNETTVKIAGPLCRRSADRSMCSSPRTAARCMISRCWSRCELRSGPTPTNSPTSSKAIAPAPPPNPWPAPPP